MNAVLPLRYFTFLPKREHCPLPKEPGEQDFVEIICIWMNKHLASYCDRGSVSPRDILQLPAERVVHSCACTAGALLCNEP